LRETFVNPKHPRARAANGRFSSRTAAVSAASGMSWLALVAATTLGLGHLARVRAEISAEPGLAAADAEGVTYRLVVQSYESNSVGADQLPAVHARPLTSTQRSITAEELENGIAVDMVQIDEPRSESAPVVVAWVERGAPDLELDGMSARPASDAFYGVSRDARVVLRRRGA
jgi:hypothetical protein